MVGTGGAKACKQLPMETRRTTNSPPVSRLGIRLAALSSLLVFFGCGEGVLGRGALPAYSMADASELRSDADASSTSDPMASLDAGDGEAGWSSDAMSVTEPDASAVEPRVPPSPCAGESLRERLSLTSVAVGRGLGSPVVAPTLAGGAVIGGAVEAGLMLRWVDAAGRNVGPDTVIEGDRLWALSVGDERWAAITYAEPDILSLVTLNPGGGDVQTQRLLGGVPHDVVGNEWFGRLIREADLTWTGEHFAAYYTVNRLWPDGIAHYGDQLKVFTPRAEEVRQVWDWGCSHSMELRVAHNGSQLGAICASDCYPSKGIHYNHRGGQIHGDETASNCAGRYGTSLGGLVPQGDGFWTAFTATEERTSSDVGLRWVPERGGAMGETLWLTSDAVNDSELRFARYGASLVVAYRPGRETARFVVANLASGAASATPVSMPEVDLLTASDFFTYANGDVGWVQQGSGMLQLARLQHCDAG